MKNILVKDNIINITGISDDDYISITDIAKIIKMLIWLFYLILNIITLF